MTDQTFSLIPFPPSEIPDFQISGRVGRQNNLLTIQYSLRGETGKILLPERSMPPARKNGLWAATCFEFFLARLEDSQYWEFNLSPSGDWNIYHIDAYRRVGFREDTSIQRLQFEVAYEPGCVALNVGVDLSLLMQENHPIQLGISSVIQTLDGHEIYWALTHPDSKPDFHRRESFLIHL